MLRLNCGRQLRVMCTRRVTRVFRLIVLSCALSISGVARDTISPSSPTVFLPVLTHTALCWRCRRWPLLRSLPIDNDHRRCHLFSRYGVGISLCLIWGASTRSRGKERVFGTFPLQSNITSLMLLQKKGYFIGLECVVCTRRADCTIDATVE